MSYKPFSLFSIIGEINRDLYLPHIQRPFVWEEQQIKRLFDSLMRNYPIQTLLFWKTKSPIKVRKFMDVIEWDADLHKLYLAEKSKEGIEKTFVLDGQQRLQSLYCIFSGAIECDGKKLEAYFDITGGDKFDDSGILFELIFSENKKSLPYYRLRDLLEKDTKKTSEEISEELNDILDEQIKDDGDIRKNRQKCVRKNISQVVSLIREDRFFWIETLDGVSNNYPYDKILEIFIRVNSGGTKLDAADLMFAAMKEGWEDVEQEVEETVEMINNGRLAFDKNFILKSLLVSIGKGAELNPSKFTGSESSQILEKIENEWPNAEEAFQQLRDFITIDLKLYSDKVIRSYLSFVPLFEYILNNPKPNQKNKHLMKAYYYKSQLFNWYSGRTDGIIDYLHNNFLGKSGIDFPLTQICGYFRNNHEKKTELTVDNMLDMRLRYILLNMIYVEKNSTSAFDVRYKGNEPHIDHIYPKSQLYKLDLSTEEINHIGNYQYLGATENIKKRAEYPEIYFTRIKKDGVEIEKHLLCKPESENPIIMKMTAECYRNFRDRRVKEIFNIANKVVNAIYSGDDKKV